MLPRELRRGPYPVAGIARGLVSDEAEIAAIRAVFAEQTGGARSVILSDENILGFAHDPAMRKTSTFYPDGHLRLSRVMRALGIGSADLFLALRDPAGFLVSAYSQRVTARGYLAFEKYLKGADPCTMFWSEFVARLATVPGVNSITVWRYEDYPRVARSVLKQLLPAEIAGSIVPPASPAQTGLSAAAHAMMEQLVRDGDVVDVPRARALREAYPKGDDFPGFQPFPDGVTEDSARYYADDLADIRGIEKVTLL